MITAFWWNVDRAVKITITQRVRTEVRGIQFFYKSGIFFIQLLSGRRLAYVKPQVDLKAICEQMGRSPDWMPDILLRADGYETNFYQKD